MNAQQKRLEIKLVLPSWRQHELAAWLRTHEAAFAPVHEPRWINNIYFDTEDYTSLLETLEGDLQRMKIRLRWYGELDRIQSSRLEFKIKRGPVNWKDSVALEHAFDLRSQTWREIVATVRSSLKDDVRIAVDQASRPVLINRYHRHYFLSFDGAVRITVDQSLSWWLQSGGLRPNLRRSVRPHDGTVVECKANVNRLSVLSDVVRDLQARSAKHSKYAVGMAGLQ